MKERPILFSGEMVRAILGGRKTQTRRVVKPQPPAGIVYLEPETCMLRVRAHDGLDHHAWNDIRCPYGQPGDRLWVRETWTRVHPAMLQSLDPDPDSHEWETVYRADANGGYVGRMLECTRWRPSIHMPRWASRLTLEITSVRVKRLHDISEEDAKAEGVESGIWDRENGVLAGAVYPEDEERLSFRDGFGFVWESIYGPESWNANPWVWVVEFKRIQP